jgi:FtsH-binding integral membrane protein
MIHPLFRLLVSEPQLLADHVEAYSELVAAEVGAVTTQLKRRAVLHGLSVGLLVVGTFFAGIAVMLWAAIPTDTMNHPWALWATPAIPLVMAVWAHFAAKAPVAEHGTQTIREQLAADAAMLRSVSAS